MTAHDAHDDGSRYFSEGSFRILGLRFCRCVKKEQNQRRGPLTFTELPDCYGRGTEGEDRSTEIALEIFKRPVISGSSTIQLTAPAMPVCLVLRNTTIIASLPLLASFGARAEPVVLIRKTIRIIYRNPSASRPLPSKTDRDTSLEGFFWRCL